MTRTYSFLVAALLSCLPLSATAVPLLTLDFNGNVQSDYRLGVFERGYRFSNAGSGTSVEDNSDRPGGLDNDTPYLIALRGGLRIERRDEQPFTLLGLDIGLAFTSLTALTTVASLTHPDGSVTMRSIDLDRSFQTIAFADEVRRVEFSLSPETFFLGLDNVVVAGVPEPPTLMLLTLGIVAASRRRKAVRG